MGQMGQIWGFLKSVFCSIGGNLAQFEGKSHTHGYKFTENKTRKREIKKSPHCDKDIAEIKHWTLLHGSHILHIVIESVTNINWSLFEAFV